MNWTDAIDLYGEIGARAIEQAEAHDEWAAWVEADAA